MSIFDSRSRATHARVTWTVVLLILAQPAPARTWNIYENGSGDARSIQRAMELAASKGVTLTWYDSDGDIRPFIPDYLSVGINGLAPCEVPVKTALGDPHAPCKRLDRQRLDTPFRDQL